MLSLRSTWRIEIDLTRNGSSQETRLLTICHTTLSTGSFSSSSFVYPSRQGDPSLPSKWVTDRNPSSRPRAQPSCADCRYFIFRGKSMFPVGNHSTGNHLEIYRRKSPRSYVHPIYSFALSGRVQSGCLTTRYVYANEPDHDRVSSTHRRKNCNDFKWKMMSVCVCGSHLANLPIFSLNEHLWIVWVQQM